MCVCVRVDGLVKDVDIFVTNVNDRQAVDGGRGPLDGCG